MVGQTTYFVLRTDEGGVARITGRVVEEKSDTLVAAVHPSDSLGLKHRLTSQAPGDSTEISFLRVPLDSCAYTRPTNWRGRDPGSLPAGELCLAAWGEVGKEVLISSEAERAPKGNPSKSSGSALAAELEKMQDMFKGSESESSGSDSDAVPVRESRSRHLPPGGKSAASSKEHRERGSSSSKDPSTALMQEMLQKSLVESKSPNEMLPVMMMSLLLEREGRKTKKSRSRRRKSSPGGSSSGSSDGSAIDEEKGMKAVNSLHRLQRRIRRHPKSIYQAWEADLVKEMGVVPGQAWTVKDYLKRQSWGKYKGILRCAMMDAQAYEYLRAGQVESATAQLCQNMKAKLQSVIQQGDWSSAWLLVGMADPLARKEFGGSQEEMSVIADYMSSLSKLRKRVKENKDQSGQGAAEED